MFKRPDQKSWGSTLVRDLLLTKSVRFKSAAFSLVIFRKLKYLVFPTDFRTQKYLFRVIFFCWQSSIVFSLDFSPSCDLSPGSGQIHCLPGPRKWRPRQQFATEITIPRGPVPELSPLFSHNYPRFLSRLHCLLWALVMTNWLDTTNLCYPAPLPTTNLNIHTRLFSFTGPQFPEFLLPFRKPKRIRTAFSPSQLLKLEHAFEKNQYVVGQERKELAKSLNLSETQVNSKCYLQ